MVRTGQKYSTTLQAYNTSLQADLTAEKSRRDEVQRAKDELQGQAAELGGKVRSLEQLLAYERVGQGAGARGGSASGRAAGQEGSWLAPGGKSCALLNSPLGRHMTQQTLCTPTQCLTQYKWCFLSCGSTFFALLLSRRVSSCKWPLVSPRSRRF